jgi:aminoglycoside 6'-N-acetyltransferase I
VIIETGGTKHLREWAALRAALWPASSAAEHRAELEGILVARDAGSVAFVAVTAWGAVVGFAEATLRHDHVNGCDTSPVAFLEGIYVRTDLRRHGIAQALCHAVEAWGRAAGCTEMGSDADLANVESHSFHIAVGFEERERVVFFRKPL